MYYWVVSLISVVFLIASFKKMKLVMIVMVFFTWRNIAPLYDPEQRKKVMG